MKRKLTSNLLSSLKTMVGICVMLIITFPSVCHAQNGDTSPCVALLKDGLRDVYTTANNVSFFSDSKQYFSSNEFIKDYHEGKWNGGISAIIDGVTLGLTGGASDNDLHQFQQKIESASAVVINLSTYFTISKSTINVDLANAFNDCIANTEQYGPSININPSNDDNSVIITLNYKSLGTAQNPTISSVNLVGILNADIHRITTTQLRIGSRIQPSISFTATRNPKQDLLVAVNTSNGLSAIKRASAIDDNNSVTFPVGTVVTSVLDFDSFSKLTKSNGDNGVWSPVKSKWAPCDGRSVVGSKYQILWAGPLGPNVPDLRGIFLRGLNQFDPAEVTAVDISHRNPNEPARNVVEADAVGAHSHVLNYRAAYIMDMGAWQNAPKENFIETANRPAYGGSVGNITALPDPNLNETRPKSISIYYYIRIN